MSVLVRFPYTASRILNSGSIRILAQQQNARIYENKRLIHAVKETCKSVLRVGSPDTVIPSRTIIKPAAFFEKSRLPDRTSRNYALLIVPVATFCLGTWQLQRLKWKLGLIDERTTRIRAPPLTYEDLPESEDDIGDLEYRRVTLRGKFDHSREIYLVPRSPINSQGGGLISSTASHGGHVITPFTLAESDVTILVDRGWVPKSQLDPVTRPQGQIRGEVTVIGALRKSEKGNRFSPVHKEGSRNFAVRRVRDMAAQLGVTPLLIDATKESNIPGGPTGGQTIVEMRNEHLNYAITWYSLSVITALLWYHKYVRRMAFR